MAFFLRQRQRDFATWIQSDICRLRAWNSSNLSSPCILRPPDISQPENMFSSPCQTPHAIPPLKNLDYGFCTDDFQHSPNIYNFSVSKECTLSITPAFVNPGSSRIIPENDSGTWYEGWATNVSLIFK